MATSLHVFHALHRAHSAVFRAADGVLKQQIGLTATQQAVLFALLQRDGAPISDIADTLCMGRSSLTGLVDRMAEAGLVRRAFDDQDARRVLVFLEPTGRNTATQALAATKAANEALLAPFNENDREIVARFLDYLAENAATLIPETSVIQSNAENSISAKRTHAK